MKKFWFSFFRVPKKETCDVFYCHTFFLSFSLTLQQRWVNVSCSWDIDVTELCVLLLHQWVKCDKFSFHLFLFWSINPMTEVSQRSIGSIWMEIRCVVVWRIVLDADVDEGTNSMKSICMIKLSEYDLWQKDVKIIRWCD